MSYYQSGINTPDPDRMCIFPSPSAYYYTGGRGYFPLQEWFDFAEMLLSNAVRPMSPGEQKELFDNIQGGRDISSLIEVGRHQAKLPFTNYLTLFGILSVFAIFIRTFFSHWRKKELVPVHHNFVPKGRFSALPTVIAIVPLFVLTLVFGIILSFGLFYTYRGIHKYDHNIHNGIIDRPTNLQNEMLFVAQCQYDNVFMRGNQKLLHEIHEASGYVSDSCKPTVDLLKNRLETIQRDQDSLEELFKRSEELTQQFKEIQSLRLMTDEEDINDMKYSETIMKKIGDELKLLNNALVELNKNATNSLLEARKIEEGLRDEVNQVTSPLVASIVEVVSRSGQVKHSLDEATKIIMTWTKTVATRIMKALESDKAKIDPFVVFVSIQGLAGVGVLTALVGLGSGAFILALMIAFPKLFYYAPRLTGWLVQLFLCSLCFLSAFTFSILFLSGMFLAFAGPITSVCDTLNKFDNNNTFYTTNDIHFGLKDFNGTVHNVNLGQFLEMSEDLYGHGLALENVNHHKNLLPRFEDEIKLNRWTNYLDEIRDPGMANISIPALSKPIRQLKMSALGLETVSIKELRSEKARKSPLLHLVSKELQTFKRLLDTLPFRSLDAVEIPGCHLQKLDDVVKDNLHQLFAASFGELNKWMDSRFYRSDQMLQTYLGSSRLLCVDYRIPSIGCWLASFVLGFVMLLDMLVVKKVAFHLSTIPRPDSDDNDATVETTTVSLDSPLLEEKTPFKTVDVVKT